MHPTLEKSAPRESAAVRALVETLSREINLEAGQFRYEWTIEGMSWLSGRTPSTSTYLGQDIGAVLALISLGLQASRSCLHGLLTHHPLCFGTLL